jgi:integrase
MLHWVDNVARPDLAPNTYESYRWEIKKHIVPVIGHIPLADFTPDLLQDFYSYKVQAGSIRKPPKSKEKKPTPPPAPRGLSNRSVQYLHSILNQALEHAVDLELLDRNPCAKIKPPRDKKTKRHHRRLYVLSVEQLVAFLGFARDHTDYALIYVAAYTGARQSELLGLTWGKIDWAAPAINIHAALHLSEQTGEFSLGPVKNATSHRAVAVTQDVLAVLKDHKARLEAAGFACGDNSLVFPNKSGGFINRKNLSGRFSNLAARAGHEGFTFHGLRHTHATLLLESGEYINAVSERLGHANVDTTLRIYGHVLPQKPSQVASRFSALLTTDPGAQKVP